MNNLKLLLQRTVFLLLFFSPTITLSQSRILKPCSFSIEAGGSGGLGSLNLERDFKKTEKWTFHWRAGLSYTPIDKNNGAGIIFPLLVHGVYGQKAHKLDLAIGQGITITTHGQFFTRTPLVVGYRFQPIDKHYYLRIAYTPLVSYLVDFQLQHWGGITFGYTFQKP